MTSARIQTNRSCETLSGKRCSGRPWSQIHGKLHPMSYPSGGYRFLLGAGVAAALVVAVVVGVGI